MTELQDALDMELALVLDDIIKQRGQSGHLALTASEVRSLTQCFYFAGFGVFDYLARTHERPEGVNTMLVDWLSTTICYPDLHDAPCPRLRFLLGTYCLLAQRTNALLSDRSVLPSKRSPTAAELLREALTLKSAFRAVGRRLPLSHLYYEDLDDFVEETRIHLP